MRLHHRQSEAFVEGREDKRRGALIEIAQQAIVVNIGEKEELTAQLIAAHIGMNLFEVFSSVAHDHQWQSLASRDGFESANDAHEVFPTVHRAHIEEVVRRQLREVLFQFPMRQFFIEFRIEELLSRLINDLHFLFLHVVEFAYIAFRSFRNGHDALCLAASIARLEVVDGAVPAVVHRRKGAPSHVVHRHHCRNSSSPQTHW